tara:strand:- start:148 stop:420 length:273 start_codon:yes stop_codon:yes gene_type:complete
MSKQKNPITTRQELEQVITALEKKGVKFNSKEENYVGLGDVVESTLQTFGVTEERFKSWFNLNECNCGARKKWLNNLFSWRVRNKGEQNE